MPSHVAKPARTIWTIGHSNHPIETFLDLLARHQVEVLVDVRSSPYARYATHFNREPLGAAVQERAMQYLFLGDLLGGRADDPSVYDEQGRADYRRMAESPGFRRGVERLFDGIERFRVAIVCGEEDPANCHRRLLVGRVLRDRGVEVVHIRGDGRLQTENELAAQEAFEKTKGQLSLFDTEDPAEWKSTQSVLPRKAPPSFSTPCDAPESSD